MLRPYMNGNLYMAYNPAIHHRRSLRIPGYDYSQNGAYFITVCTHNHKCIFGNIIDGEMKLNGFGEIIQTEWEKTVNIRAEIKLGEYVIMPNHFHAIVFITTESCRGVRPDAPTIRIMGPKPKSIGALMAGFKSSVTNQINKIRNTPKSPVWQRNYWEHIIRDEKSFDEISTYIINNPGKWQFDKLFQSDP